MTRPCAAPPGTCLARSTLQCRNRTSKVGGAAMLRSKAAAIGRAGIRGARRHWVLITVPIVLLVIAAYVLAFMLDEPLRRITQGKMNNALKGYTAIIKTLDFHPFGFSLDLR